MKIHRSHARLHFPLGLFLSLLIASLVALPAPANAASPERPEPVPIVYQVNELTVRAGVPQAHGGILHLGDRLALFVQLSFDDTSVHIQSVDTLREEWGKMTGLHVRGMSVHTRTDGGKKTVETAIEFQLLTCPEAMGTSCVGPKVYRLPILALDYRLVDESGNESGAKTARFRPWPGEIVVSPALPVTGERIDSFTTYFPRGGYLPPLKPANHVPLGLWLGSAGGLLLIGTLLPEVSRLRRAPSLKVNEEEAMIATRWRGVLDRLQSDTLSTDDFSDTLRRALVQYCVDTLGVDPFLWFDAEGRDRPDSAHVREVRNLFLDASKESAPDADKRTELIARLRRILMSPPAPAGVSDP